MSTPADVTSVRERRHERLVGATALVFGAVMGIATSVWQTATESAQVQAGLITYPPGNSFGMYHHKLWVLVVQLAAVAIAAGADERTVNFVMTAAMGALSFVGLALLTWAFCRSVFISIAAPCFIWAAGLYALGTTYTIWIFGSMHTYGILGTAYGVLCLALLGLGRTRALAFALGVAPAMHPSIGAWIWGVAALTLALEPRRLRARLTAGARAFFAGLFVTAVSFAHHLYFSQGLPSISGAEARRYIDGFTRRWDDHRWPVAMASPGVLTGAATVVTGASWLRLFPDELLERERNALRAATVAAALALICSALSHVQPWLPFSVRMAMPWRNMNITSLAFVAITLGLSAKVDARGGRLRPTLPLVLVSSIALLSEVKPGWNPPLANVDLHLESRQLRMVSLLAPVGSALIVVLVRLREVFRERSSPRRAWDFLFLPGCVALLLVGALRIDPQRDLFPWCIAFSWVSLAALTALFAGLSQARLIGLARSLIAVILGISVWKTVVDAREGWTHLGRRLEDHRSSSLLSQASRMPGFLLVGSDLNRVQIRTGRRILLYGHALNSLPYVPESGPDMERVLREIYGIELLKPGPPRRGGLDPNDGRELWESRSATEWRALARRYDLGGVLTPRTWSLNLRLIERDRGYSLYSFDP